MTGRPSIPRRLGTTCRCPESEASSTDRGRLDRWTLSCRKSRSPSARFACSGQALHYARFAPLRSGWQSFALVS